MTRLSHEQLLGYLLGALDRQEGLEVEQAVAQDAELRSELEKIRRSLDAVGLLDDPEHEPPPLCLAARTCEFVELKLESFSSETIRLRGVTADAIEAADEVSEYAAAASIDSSGRRVKLTPVSHSEVQGYAYRKLDLLVICSTVVVGAALCFPLLFSSKFQANVTYCQNQLVQLGKALHQHSELQPDGSFPHVPADGNRSFAGIFGPALATSKLIDNPKQLVCPGSPRLTAPSELPMATIPTLAEIDSAPAPLLKKYQENAGGDFGYNMGFFADNEVLPPRNSRRANYPLLADAPSDSQPFRASPHHAGRGQNFLYEDGHVNFINVSNLLRDNADGSGQSPLDDPFHNRHGKVAAGIDIIDAVLGRSEDPPLPLLP